MGNKTSGLKTKQHIEVLSPIEKRRITNAFYIFDVAGDGKIEVSKLPTILKALDYCLTRDQTDMLAAKAKIKRSFSLKKLLQIIARIKFETHVKSMVAEAYKTFEKCGRNSVNINDLRETMASFAEGDISPLKIQEIVRDAVQGEETVKYEEFIRVIATQ